MPSLVWCQTPCRLHELCHVLRELQNTRWEICCNPTISIVSYPITCKCGHIFQSSFFAYARELAKLILTLNPKLSLWGLHTALIQECHRPFPTCPHPYPLRRGCWSSPTIRFDFFTILPSLISTSLLAPYVSICGLLGGFKALEFMYDPHMIIHNCRREVLAA